MKTKKHTLNKELLRVKQQEDFILEITEKIQEAMEIKEISQSELARRLGKTRSYISQLFDGERNMTLRTVADLFWAIEMSVAIELKESKSVEKTLEMAS